MVALVLGTRSKKRRVDLERFVRKRLRTENARVVALRKEKQKWRRSGGETDYAGGGCLVKR